MKERPILFASEMVRAILRRQEDADAQADEDAAAIGICDEFRRVK